MHYYEMENDIRMWTLFYDGSNDKFIFVYFALNELQW